MVSRQIIRAEIRRFFTEQRSLLVLPALFASALVALWPYTTNWFVPVAIGTFVILEPTFNNILFRSPNEFELLAVTPVAWTTVVVSKNCAALLLALGLAIVLAVPTAYALPYPVTVDQLVSGGGLFLSLLFPMVMAGNARSVEAPRRHVGVGLSDAAEAVITIVVIGIASLPYLLTVVVLHEQWVIPVYIAASAVVWFAVSIRATARSIEHHRTRLCLTE